MSLKFEFLAIAMIIVLMLVPGVTLAKCQNYPPALLQMQQQTSSIVTNDQRTIELDYRLADTPSLTAAGFQNVCAETIQKEQILFVFANAIIPSFHMRNVQASLDIAFIDEDGLLVSIQTMQPYVLGSQSRPLYRPQQAILYALEARAGFFAEHKIVVSKAKLLLPKVQLPSVPTNK